MAVSEERSIETAETNLGNVDASLHFTEPKTNSPWNIHKLQEVKKAREMPSSSSLWPSEADKRRSEASLRHQKRKKGAGAQQGAAE